MHNVNIKEHRKTILLVTGGVILLLIIIGIIQAIFNTVNNAKIDILVAPESAIITINNKTYTNGGHKVTPGEYKIYISKDGFDPYEETVTIAKNETYKLYVALDGDNAKSWYKNHPNDDKIYTAISDFQYEEEHNDFTQKYPILNYIPYTSITYFPSGAADVKYRIDIEYNNGELIVPIRLESCSEFSINIYKQEALDWLRSKSINPDDYNIKFSSLCNNSI